MAENNEEEKATDKLEKPLLIDWIMNQAKVFRNSKIGPSGEELAKSAMDRILYKEPRPASHVAKEVAAPAVEKVIQDATGATLGKIFGKATGKAAIKNAEKAAMKTAKKAAKNSAAVKYASKLGGEATQKAVKNVKVTQKAAETSKKIADEATHAATRTVDNVVRQGGHKASEAYKSAAELAKHAKDAFKLAQGEADDAINILSDIYNDFPSEALRNKYGSKVIKAGDKYIEVSKRLKNAGDIGEELLETAKKTKLDLTSDFVKKYTSNFTDYDKMNELIDNALQINSLLKQGIDLDALPEALQKQISTMNKAIDAGTEALTKDLGAAAKKTSDKMSTEAIEEAGKALADNAGRSAALGKKVFGKGPILISIGKDKESAILSALKKNKKYSKTFEHLINPTDPIYKKLVANSDLAEKQLGLAALMQDKMDVIEAIQEKALLETLDHYDHRYISYIKKASMGKVADKIPASKIRNADGSLKAVDEIVDFLVNDPRYAETVSKYVEEITGNAGLFSTAKAIEGAGAAILGNWAKNAIQHGINNNYDPFGPETFDKKNNYPEVEFGKARKGWEMTKDMFSLNMYTDPTKYTEKQLSDLRDAALLAAEDTEDYTQDQVEGWSDAELLNLAGMIGQDKFGYFGELVQDYYKYLEDN